MVLLGPNLERLLETTARTVRTALREKMARTVNQVRTETLSSRV
jgi:hypothetical protein